jgi:hypothetical protein
MGDRTRETWAEQQKRHQRERRWELVAAAVMFISGYLIATAVPDRATWGHSLIFGAGMFIILFAGCLVLDRGPNESRRR